MRRFGIACALVPALALVGCSSGPGGGVTATSEAPAVAPTSQIAVEVTEPALSRADIETALAETVRRYIVVTRITARDPSPENRAGYEAVAIGDALIKLNNEAQEIIDKDYTFTGEAQLVSSSIYSLEPDPVIPGQPAVAVTTLCLDISSETVRRTDGSVLADEGRLPRVLAYYRLSNPDPAQPEGWRVNNIDESQTRPCDEGS